VTFYSCFTYAVLYFAVILVNVKYLRPKIKAIKNDDKFPILINAGSASSSFK